MSNKEESLLPSVQDAYWTYLKSKGTTTMTLKEIVYDFGKIWGEMVRRITLQVAANDATAGTYQLPYDDAEYARVDQLSITDLNQSPRLEIR